ncbi:hypothetical protein P171DRAFT_521502 [Karstenula rhodostoma CBS 690.94]|uniref:Uncharacterized protein n=1 Tax=Karstenula rhodostoma CBS 690.94 TaxID=1392251 RepID=A0A9P4PHP2_9PLEO|nr:hypothetical protein P171DRAFT_521502 [Karstenula rhodostoma CBS 690.94]
MAQGTSASRAGKASMRTRAHSDSDPAESDISDQRPVASQSKGKKPVAVARGNPTANLDHGQASIEGTTDILTDIYEYVRGVDKGHDLLGNLPLTEDYSFDEAPAERPPNYHAEMLFLGEANGVQSWANLRENHVGEGVVLYNYHTIAVVWIRQHSLDQLHLMYPFRVLKVYGVKGTDCLAGLVRFIYRETGKVDSTFAIMARQNLVTALRHIHNDYESQGGARFVEDMQQPSVLPSARYVRAEASTPASGAVDSVFTSAYSTPRSSIAGEKRPHNSDESDMSEEDESYTSEGDNAEAMAEYRELQEKRRIGREKRAKVKAQIRTLEGEVLSTKQEFDGLVEEDDELRERQKEILRATGRWCL